MGDKRGRWGGHESWRCRPRLRTVAMPAGRPQTMVLGSHPSLSMGVQSNA